MHATLSRFLFIISFKNHVSFLIHFAMYTAFCLSDQVSIKHIRFMLTNSKCSVRYEYFAKVFTHLDVNPFTVVTNQQNVAFFNTKQFFDFL